MRVHHNIARPASGPALGFGHRVIATSVPERHSELSVTELGQNPHGFASGPNRVPQQSITARKGTKSPRPRGVCYRCHAGSVGGRGGAAIERQSPELNIWPSDFSKD